MSKIEHITIPSQASPPELSGSLPDALREARQHANANMPLSQDEDCSELDGEQEESERKLGPFDERVLPNMMHMSSMHEVAIKMNTLPELIAQLALRAEHTCNQCVNAHSLIATKAGEDGASCLLKEALKACVFPDKGDRCGNPALVNEYGAQFYYRPQPRKKRGIKPAHVDLRVESGHVPSVIRDEEGDEENVA